MNPVGREVSSTPAESIRNRMVAVTNQVVKALDWRTVESDDYRRYIANLRWIGCPEETIADIIKADVEKLFKARRLELAGTTDGFKYWKPGNPFAQTMNPEAVQKRQELAWEQRAILKALLGTEPETSDAPTGNPFAEALSFLSPQQHQQILETRERFKSAMTQGMDGNASPETRRQQMREAERRMEEDLSGIMSPAEKEDYDLRFSQTAAKMREHLAAFEPTESEFRSIFKSRKEFEDTIADLGGRPDSASQRQAAEERFYRQTRKSLGAARHADFLRALGK